MWLDIQKKASSKARAPSLIVSVSTSIPQYRGLYSQARELAKHMLAKMEFKEVAVFRSSAFPPEVIVADDGTAALPACRLYSLGGKGELLLFAGDSSPMDSQFEFADALLGYAAGLGVKEVVSIGARWTENPLSPDADPEVKGFATDKAGAEKLKAHGVGVLGDEPAPFFASLVVALAGEHGMRGYKLSVDHGEPAPHPRSVRKLLGALSGLLKFDAPLEGLPEAGPAQHRDGAKDPGIYH